MSAVSEKIIRYLCGKLNKHVNLTKIEYTIMPFYAVARGKTPGIFLNWPDCEAQVKGFSGARYKKFDNIAAAEQFLSSEGGSVATGSTSSIKPNKSYNSNNNLKRAFSTSSSYDKNNEETSKQKRKYKKKINSSENRSSFSDDSDDMSEILNKQMDYIEKELNQFKKGINKIYGQNQKKSKLIDLPNCTKNAKNNSNNQFETDSDGYVQVYTDGACSANGKKGARAGLGVYWGRDHHLNVSEPVSGRATNNCGEIQAATRAIKQAIDNGVTNLSINTDSQFLINAVTKWMPGWKRKGWKLASGEPVKNEIDFKDLDNVKSKVNIKWNYVTAHRGVPGNEMADQLAKDGAAKYGLRHD